MTSEATTAFWVALMVLASVGFMVLRKRLFAWLDGIERAEDERVREEGVRDRGVRGERGVAEE